MIALCLLLVVCAYAVGAGSLQMIGDAGIGGGLLALLGGDGMA